MDFIQNFHTSHLNKLIGSTFEIVSKHEKNNNMDFLEKIFQNDGALAYYLRQCYKEWKISGKIIFNYSGLAEPDFAALSKIDIAYETLSDDSSKNLFDLIIQFRLAVIITNDFETVRTLFKYTPDRKNSASKLKVTSERKFHLAFEIEGFKIESSYNEFKDTWIYENYMLEGICEPQANDIVIDAGAYMGETAIWFANKIAGQGKVYAFELIQPHIDTIRMNVEKNHLEKTISIVEKGLWFEQSYINVKNEGPDTNCINNMGDSKVEVVTLDSFVEKENIERIDYIKMDVEGAELYALKGAINVVKKYKPKLAISAYHNYQDLIELPVFIKSLVPEYKIFLSQKAGLPNNTMLFATVG